MSKTIQYNNEVYNRIRLLGKGSFGTAIVYRRRRDCALVVLKEIDLTRLHGGREWRRLAIQEARIMAKLSHCNIIKYHNAYTAADETKLIIEMEYASVGTLQSYLASQSQPLEEQEILIILRQIASGLSYLHSKNIVHLDLKMANIFITVDGLAKIGDFGIAQFTQPASPQTEAALEHGTRCDVRQQSATGKCNSNSNNDNNNNNSQQVGTLAYSSPERCMGEETDSKSDIWSLGCILYELITSRPLFAAESLSELLMSIIRIHYRPIERAVAPALVNIFEQMVLRQPEARPTAPELVGLTDQLLSRIQAHRQQVLGKQTRHGRNLHHRFDLSTEAAFMAASNRAAPSNQINLPHSLVYQVRLGSRHIRVDRVNLPQTRRIKEMARGKSHYLVLTYDSIVYGWGSKHCGQLGACSLTSSLFGAGRGDPASRLRSSRSARNSVNAKDLLLAQQLDPSHGQPSAWLASSTQTLLGDTRSRPSRSVGGGSVQRVGGNQHLSKQMVFSMLAKSQPTARPFIVNELTNRKIIQVAAGDNFSVFLSKTGIVMTCGDGSQGCLGRGDLASCFTPCMVDDLLYCDVVSVACGPRHVAAVCGDGRAFAWGKFTRGRLGVAPRAANDFAPKCDARPPPHSPGPRWAQRAPSSGPAPTSSFVAGHFFTRPRPVQFPEGVFVKSAYCGDRATIFIDSNDRCWACGENRSNKLALDVKRRFKRTVIVEESWLPSQIDALSKYRIASCSIGKNHTTFLTNEGKLLVFGQDVDHSYRLRSNIQAERENCRRAESRRSHDATNRTQQGPSKSNRGTLETPPITTNITTTPSHKQLAKFLLLNDQLHSFKMARKLYQKEYLMLKEKALTLGQKISRVQRHQIDLYMCKSRAGKKMPFESVMSASCTSKSTLALTNDNRVYFWGTRSYKSEESCFCSLNGAKCDSLLMDQSLEPQLVPSQSDECFIKIGATNSSLMSSIQRMGSDQPIIHAQDPQLVAKSLADLWILDYQPPSSPSSDSVSSSLSDPSSSCSQCSTCCYCSNDDGDQNDASRCDNYFDRNLKYNQRQELTTQNPYLSYIKHDAILEPQPVVSLYIPSMFNHSGALLQVVNLFSFDEDRFYLVLDTTVRTQSTPLNVSSRNIQRDGSRFNLIGNRRSPEASIKSLRPSECEFGFEAQPFDHERPDNLLMNRFNCAAINMMTSQISEEARPSSSAASQETEIRVIPSRQMGSFRLREERSVPIRREASPERTSQGARLNSDSSLDEISQLQDGATNCITNASAATNYSSQGGGSLEEPQSFSTFAAGLGDNLIAGPTMRSMEHHQTLQPLNLNQTSQTENTDTPSSYLAPNHLLTSNRKPHQIGGSRRGPRSSNNKSESTTITGDDIDTSSMPSWVRNEYQQREHDEGKCSGELFSIDSSVGDGTLAEQSATGTDTPGSSDHHDVGSTFQNTCDIASQVEFDFDALMNPLGRSINQNEIAVQEPFKLHLEDNQRTEPNLNINPDRDCLATQLADASNFEIGGFTLQPLALSCSQPDVSVHYKQARGSFPCRRASIADETLVESSPNLLNCRVYRSTRPCQLATESSSNLNSAMSSRSGSIHPLLRPDPIALNSNMGLQINGSQESDIGQTNFVPMYEGAKLNGSQNGVSMAKSNSICDGVDAQEPNSGPRCGRIVMQTTKFAELLGPTTDDSFVSRSAVQLATDQTELDQGIGLGKARMSGSCRSVNSFRKSLVKLFC